MRVAERLAAEFPEAALFAGASLLERPPGTVPFDRLGAAVAREFSRHAAHVFIMASGIVVRAIAPLIKNKLADPAVVVVDSQGAFAISLLSGHVGGANALARKVAEILGGTAVVTTATDGAGVPAVDELARGLGLAMDNTRAIKAVSMAFLTGVPVWRYDPWGVLDVPLAEWTLGVEPPLPEEDPGIFVHHEDRGLSENVLAVRPCSLAVGVGCNSGTSEEELTSVVRAVFKEHRLALASIRLFGTHEDKIFEPGLLEMGAAFDRPVEGFAKELLASVKNVPNPSEVVEQHMGVKSVCEAAAMLGASGGELLVPKVKSGNVTVAVAAMPFTLPEQDPEHHHSSHHGH
jgi:cobalt-precorrin 5A hydrolase